MANLDGMSCKICKWFRPGSEPEYREGPYGTCMYNPPIFNPSSWSHGRPFTHMNDYCSRYEKRNEEKENADA